MAKQRIWMSVLVVVALGLGCVYGAGGDSEERATVASGPELEPERISTLGNKTKVREYLRPWGKISAVPSSDDEVPTGLRIVSCEVEPAEVAVPLNATEGKYCDSVQLTAFRADDEGTYEVSADFVWAIEDPEVAALGPAIGTTARVRRLYASYDTFTADDALEPATELLVCAVPKQGAPEFAPLCRSLPVRNTINVEGAWCFSGATFQTDCDDLILRQDGRYLYFDAWGVWSGRVLNRKVEFSRGGYVYRGYLDASNQMHGWVYPYGGDDEVEPIGEWSAWQLPLF